MSSLEKEANPLTHSLDCSFQPLCLSFLFRDEPFSLWSLSEGLWAPDRCADRSIHYGVCIICHMRSRPPNLVGVMLLVWLLSLCTLLTCLPLLLPSSSSWKIDWNNFVVSAGPSVRIHHHLPNLGQLLTKAESGSQVIYTMHWSHDDNTHSDQGIYATIDDHLVQIEQAFWWNINETANKPSDNLRL